MPNTYPAAVLFDMDGTLIDSEHHWLSSEQELAASWGANWTSDDGEALIGMSLYQSTKLIKEKLGIDLTPDQITEILTDAVIAKLDAEIVWRPGVLELMADLKANGVKTALVTMSMRRMALRVAAKLPVGEFDVVVAGDDVTNGKPHPEPYLLAAEQLGVDVKDCIAFEDSVTGLTSAEASGAIAIGIPNIVQLPEQEGRLIWPTLQGVKVETLAGLHKEKRAQTD
jgi:HAD superfamily hydrolase (TIGR01509 family)